MKKLKNILAIALAASTLFAVGCNNGNQTSDQAETLAANILPDYQGGIHEFNYTETSDYLVKNNQTEYAILVPANMSEEMRFAAGELRQLFKEATKGDLAIVTDDTVGEYSADKKYISLGNTTYAAAVNAKPTEELERYGYSIKTVDNSIFINANSEIGVTFGVYGFLQVQFNFDCFSDQYYVIDKMNDAPLLDLAVRNVPDLGMLRKSTQFQDGSALRRMGCLADGDAKMPQTAGSSHSTLLELPFVDYGEAHSEWYSLGTNSQLCYTARGDEEEFEALLQIVTDKVTTSISKASESQYTFSFGQMDVQVWCTCDACTEIKEKYNSECATQILFINKVAERVNAWMETEEGQPYADKDYEIRYWIYHRTVEAPVKYDETMGKYVPVDDSVIPAEHTFPVLAPLDMDFLCDIDSKCNEAWIARLDKWNAILNDDLAECGAFSYFRNYSNNLLYYDSYTNMQNWYKYLANFNVGWFYDEGSPASVGGSNWTALKGYLITKLAWNVNLKIEDLTQKFFQNYYGEAGEEMYDVFLATRAVGSKDRLVLCNARSKFTEITLMPQLYPEELAVDSLAKIEKGLSDITYLQKVDPAKYQTFYKNIAAERLAYEYILIEFYGGRYDPDELLDLKYQAKDDASINSIGGLNDDTSLTTIWARWGIA